MGSLGIGVVIMLNLVVVGLLACFVYFFPRREAGGF